METSQDSSMPISSAREWPRINLTGPRKISLPQRKRTAVKHTILRGANSIRYGALKMELVNNTTKGQDNYPKTMVETARLLNIARSQHALNAPVKIQERVWHSSRAGGSSRASAARDPNNPNCWHCSQPGHHMCRCLDLAVEGIDNFNINEADNTHAFFTAEGGKVAANIYTTAK